MNVADRIYKSLLIRLLPCTAMAISSRIRFASELVEEKKLASADANPILRRCEPTLNNFDSKPVQLRYLWLVQRTWIISD